MLPETMQNMTMRKNACTSALRIGAIFIAVSAVSGCGEPGVWFGGKYYGPPADLAPTQPVADQTSLAPEFPAPAESPPPPVTPSVSAALPPADSAYQYLIANEKMDRAYQNLTTHMTTDQQLALSQEQTVWLNSRTDLCSKSGVMDYVCAVRLTSTRISVLQSRIYTLPPYAPPAPEAPPQPPAATVAAAPAPAPPAPAPASPAPGAAAPPLPAITTTPAPTAAPPPLAAIVLPPAPQPMAAAAKPHAASYTVTGTAMPWLWHPGGLNNAYQFGIQDGTAPTIVSLSKLDAAPGQSLTIHYVNGEIALGFQSPETDANGYSGQSAYGGNGVSGRPLPSAFMRPYPINLGALIGVFTNSEGGIIGAPFAIGDDAITKQIPGGASRLQLGVNDDIYGGANTTTANSGSFTVAVSTGP